MAFDYVVTLDLAGRQVVLAGGGPLAVDRLAGLVESGASVRLVTPAPSAPLVTAAEAAGVVVHRRELAEDDLDGAFLVVVTREDDHDVPALYAAARARGALVAALDDVVHSDVGAVSQLRRGDLRVTVSSAGRAPALSKRVRRLLEQLLPEELEGLVEAIDDVKRRHGPRGVDFATWSRRWEAALADLDGLVALERAGDRAAVEQRILATITEDAAAPEPPA